MIKYNNEIENMNTIMYSIFNKLPSLISLIFNNLPIELVKVIKNYLGVISKDILFIYDRLQSTKIKWAIYEKPTTDIYRIVKIIPLLFKKGKYTRKWEVPKIDTKTQIQQIETQTEIITECYDYDLNDYDFEYYYKYVIECLKTFCQQDEQRCYPIRNIYISRLDLIISFLLLGYELDPLVFNYNIQCICKLNYTIDNYQTDEYRKLEKKKRAVRSLYKNKNKDEYETE
jgi:hypothetical protein